MIFGLLIIYNHDRMSSITRVQVLHYTTWVYFTIKLPYRFFDSPKEVKESIMTDVNDLVEEFWKTSSASDEAVGASFFAMRCLFEILKGCFDYLEVCFDIISDFATSDDLANKNLQALAEPTSRHLQYSAHYDERIRAEINILCDGYQKILDHSLSEFQDLGDMLRFLPGVVVQNHMSMQGMIDLYGNKPDLLERLIKSNIMINLHHDNRRQLSPGPSSRYKLDPYLSGLLQDRDCSRLYYRDPMLQHISICRRFLSLLDRSDDLDFQSYVFFRLI